MKFSSIVGTGSAIVMACACAANPFNKVAGVGDSIMEGYPNYLTAIDNGGVASGDTNANVMLYSSRITPGGITTTNVGRAGYKFTLIIPNQMPSVLAFHATNMFVHCGLNDLFQNETLPNTIALLDDIKLMCSTNGIRLWLDEVFPNNQDDATAVKVRLWNARFHEWGITNNVVVFYTHDAMGQLRVSTGFLDDLKTAYSQDGTHLTTNGVATWATLIYQQVNVTTLNVTTLNITQ